MKNIFILFILTCFVFGQAPQPDIHLVNVQVEGNVLTSENTIIFTAGLRMGQDVSPTEFPRAIKRLSMRGEGIATSLLIIMKIQPFKS